MCHGMQWIRSPKTLDCGPAVSYGEFLWVFDEVVILVLGIISILRFVHHRHITEIRPPLKNLSNPRWRSHVGIISLSRLLDRYDIACRKLIGVAWIYI